MALFDNLTVEERVALAKQRTEKVVDHLRESILMHEANAIVVYSPTLAKQIPTSYAAHAFIQFQRSMHFFEIVRLCALWDPASRDRESVPTVVQLVDRPNVKKELAARIHSHWAQRPEWDQKFGAERATRDIELLERTIERAREVQTSERLRSVKTMRDESLAHSLTATRLENREPVAPMKYGDERWLFDESLAVVDGLHTVINGSNFMWENARETARRNSRTLWEGCRFTIKERS
jgi:hypothetical protein